MKKFKLVIKIVILLFVFIFGFFTSGVFYLCNDGCNGIFNFVGRAIDTGNVETLPSDFLNDKDILVYNDKIVLKINNAGISNYESNSMQPFLGKGANGIVIKPQSSDEIKVGDIVTFRREDKLIVHRVVEKGTDEGGIYFITKGDNVGFTDGKVRFDEIEHKLVGIVY